jgi:hypothetical protein
MILQIVENEISTIFQRIIMSSLSDGKSNDVLVSLCFDECCREGLNTEARLTGEAFAAGLNDYVTAFAADQINREENQRTVMKQLHEMKSMLKRTKQAINTCGPRRELQGTLLHIGFMVSFGSF